MVANPAAGDVYANFRKVRPWPAKERLGGERDTLGLYVTGHPIDEYEEEIRKFASCRIAELRADNQKSQRIAGLVVAMRTMRTKRGDSMAILQLDDRTARIEVTVFAEAYNEHRELLVKDRILIVEGTVSHDEYNGGLSMRSTDLRSLLQARESYASELTIQLREDMVDAALAQKLQQLFQHSNGQCPVIVNYSQTDNRASIRLGDSWRVSPSDDLLQQLRDCCGGQNVRLNYPQ